MCSQTTVTVKQAETNGFWDRILTGKYPRPDFKLSHTVRASYMEGTMEGDDLLESFSLKLIPIKEEALTAPLHIHTFET